MEHIQVKFSKSFIFLYTIFLLLIASNCEEVVQPKRNLTRFNLENPRLNTKPIAVVASSQEIPHDVGKPKETNSMEKKAAEEQHEDIVKVEESNEQHQQQYNPFAHPAESSKLPESLSENSSAEPSSSSRPVVLAQSNEALVQPPQSVVSKPNVKIAPHSTESLHEHVERYQLHQAEEDDSEEELELRRQQVLRQKVNQKGELKGHSLSESTAIRVGPNTRLGNNPEFNKNFTPQLGIRKPLPILRKEEEQRQPPLTQDHF